MHESTGNNEPDSTDGKSESILIPQEALDDMALEIIRSLSVQSFLPRQENKLCLAVLVHRLRAFLKRHYDVDFDGLDIDNPSAEMLALLMYDVKGSSSLMPSSVDWQSDIIKTFQQDLSMGFYIGYFFSSIERIIFSKKDLSSDQSTSLKSLFSKLRESILERSFSSFDEHVKRSMSEHDAATTQTAMNYYMNYYMNMYKREIPEKRSPLELISYYGEIIILLLSTGFCGYVLHDYFDYIPQTGNANCERTHE